MTEVRSPLLFFQKKLNLFKIIYLLAIKAFLFMLCYLGYYVYYLCYVFNWTSRVSQNKNLCILYITHFYKPYSELLLINNKVLLLNILSILFLDLVVTKVLHTILFVIQYP